MTISFEVGAIFSVVDEASPVLDRLAEQFSALDELVTGLKSNLETLGSRSLAGLEDGLSRLSDQFAGITDGARTFGSALSESLDAAAAAMSRVSSEAQGIVDAYARAADAARNFATTAREAGAAGAGGGGGGRRGGGSGEGDFEPLDGWNGRSRRDYRDAIWENQNYNSRMDSARAGANYEENERQGAYDRMRREADGENADYDRRERQRVRDAQPDADFDGPRRGGSAVVNTGGSHGLLHGMMPLIEVGSGYEAYKKAMEEDLALRQTLIGMNIDPSGSEGQADIARLRELSYGATRGTIFSEATAAHAMVETAPVLGFQGEEGMEKFSKTFPVALRLGELSQMRGKGSLGSEAVAGEEFAHLTNQYDPQGLEKELDLINAISMRADTSIGRQLSIMKYGLPVAMAAGIDPNRASAEMGAAEQILGATSTVGTGYSQMILSVLKSGGGINSHLEQSSRDSIKKEEREFQKTLKLDPEAEKDYNEHSKGSKHDDAMKAFGFTEQVVADAIKSGNLDLVIEQKVHDYSEKHPDDAFSKLVDLMGVRGAREAQHYLAPDALTRESRYIQGVTTAMPVRQEQEKLSESPMQQFEQMLSNMQNIGNTLATATLPSVNEALKVFNNVLTTTNDFLKNHHDVAEAGGLGMLGLGGLALFGGAKALVGKAWGGVRGLFGGGGAAAEAGAAAEGAGAAEAGGMLGLGPLLQLGGIAWTAQKVHSLMDSGSDALFDMIWGKGAAERYHKDLDKGAPSILSSAHAEEAHHSAAPTSAPKAHPPSIMWDHADKAAPTVQAPITIHLGPVSMNGIADQHTFDDLLHRLKDALTHALTHATGTGQGSDATPFVFGGT